MSYDHDRDGYGEVITGPKTCKAIADHLLITGTCLVGWTDQSATHFDILFSYKAPVLGSNIQGGLRTNDLFVSVMRLGCFGFEISSWDTHPGYYNEKLGGVFSGVTAEKLAKLINGVKYELCTQGSA